MTEEPIFYRRNLPHIQPVNAHYFITFRLANTVPRAALEEMLKERLKEEQIICQKSSGPEQQNELYRLHKKYFGRYDAWLDRCTHGPRWLEDERAASIVAKEIHNLDQVRYRLLAYCVMPNHVHLVIDTSTFSEVSPSNLGGTTRKYPLSDTLRLLKGRTARYCNQALGQSGAFWHHEGYDHIVRDDRELERIIRYCLENPVKAGLVQNWQAWKFTYMSPELGEW